MSKKPVLEVTNPVLLWLFQHGWEDPEWGKSTIGQVVIATTIHELASHLADAELKTQIKSAAAKSISNHGEKLAAGG